MAEYADHAIGLYLVLAVAAINIVAFFSFWRDKQLARNGAWRISEGTLLSLAFLGGSIGAVMGQQLFRHKTIKEPFCTQLRLIIYLQAIIAAALLATWLVAPMLPKQWIELVRSLVLPQPFR